MTRDAPSLKVRLALALVATLAVLIAAGAYGSYRTALAAITTAHDRSLLAVARVIAERVDVRAGKVFVDVPYVALDFFESTLRGRVYYKVSGLDGSFVSGFDGLPGLPPDTPRTQDYYALAHFHDATFEGEGVRMVSLYQPVFDDTSRGMALVQVAETLESRAALTQALFLDTLARQLVIVALAALLVVVVVWHAMRPIDRVSAELSRRRPDELAPLEAPGVPSEVRPLVSAMNRQVERLKSLLDEQERFIAEASHQLRTALAVMRTQVDVAQREIGPARPAEALEALDRSLGETIQVTHQLLGRARARHGTLVKRHGPVDLAAIVRQVCMDLAPGAVARDVDLGYEGPAAMPLRGDDALLREAVRNLVENAIRHTPGGGRVTACVEHGERGGAVLQVDDTGPGIPEPLRETAFEPFVRLEHGSGDGAGLGLAIVRDVVRAHGGEVSLSAAPAGGLRVRAVLPAG